MVGNIIPVRCSHQSPNVDYDDVLTLARGHHTGYKKRRVDGTKEKIMRAPQYQYATAL